MALPFAAVLGVVVGAELLSGQPAPSMFRGGTSHAGVIETEGVAALGGIAWEFKTGGTVRSSPSVVAGVVFIGSSDGNLYALDASTGKERWRYRAGAAVGGTPLVTERLVVVMDRTNRLHAVDRTSGTQVWAVATGPDLPLRWGWEGWDYIVPSPVSAGDQVLVGSGDGNLYALDLETGRHRWRFTTGGRIRGSAAVHEGVAYIGSGDGLVYGVSLDDGKEVWRFETRGTELKAEDWGFDRTQIQASPAVSDGVLYIGSRDGLLYAVELEGRSPRWTFEDGTSWVAASPALQGRTVFSARSGSGRVHAVNAETGEVRWVFQTGGFVYSSPVAVDGMVYVGSEDRAVYALNAVDGSLEWRFVTGGEVFSTPFLWEGMLYVGSDDGSVYAVQAAEGSPPVRAVYWDDTLTSRSVLGRAEEHGATLRYFLDWGYQQVDAGALVSFLEERTSDGVPSVVVFAMDGLPGSVLDGGEQSLMRRYLEAGGKGVWFSFPPGLLVRDDSTGQVLSVLRSIPTQILGVDHRGWDSDVYGMIPTDEGRAWGLETSWVGTPSVTSEQAHLRVLARDEKGQPGAWVRSYGGASGTGWLHIGMRGMPGNLDEIRRAAEYGVFRSRR